MIKEKVVETIQSWRRDNFEIGEIDDGRLNILIEQLIEDSKKPVKKETKKEDTRAIFDEQMKTHDTEPIIHSVRINKKTIYDEVPDKLYDKWMKEYTIYNVNATIKNFICKNGCTKNPQDRDFPEYCVKCVPWYSIEECEECGCNDVPWDFKVGDCVCSECGARV